MTTAHPQKVDEYLLPYHWCLGGFYGKIHDLRARLAFPWLGKNDHVLDLGGGDGKLVSLYAKQVKEVVLLDFNSQAIAFANLFLKRYENAHAQVATAEKIPYPDQAFDKVFFIEVIEHLTSESAIKALQEIRRVLKPGGMLFLSTPNRRNLRSRIWGERQSPDKHEHEYALNELKELISGNGFSILSEKGIYLPFPLPRAEHYANVFPFRTVFSYLIDLGKNFPSLAETIWIAARRN